MQPCDASTNIDWTSANSQAVTAGQSAELFAVFNREAIKSALELPAQRASDEMYPCERFLHCSGPWPNQQSVSPILWSTRWLLLLWLTSRELLRLGAGRSRLGLHTQSARWLWRSLSCFANA